MHSITLALRDERRGFAFPLYGHRTGQGEGKSGSKSLKRAPGFFRIMSPVSEGPSAPLSQRVPMTSRMPGSKARLSGSSSS